MEDEFRVQATDNKCNTVDYASLGYALRLCWDLPMLQNSELVKLPSVIKRARKENGNLELAKALRDELIACAAQITRRNKYPIEQIVSAIENNRQDLGNENVMRIKKELGIPFPRDRIDLARYYTIRLVMEGISNKVIAEFLQVEPRTVANYISQAKKRIRLILEYSSVPIGA